MARTQEGQMVDAPGKHASYIPKRAQKVTRPSNSALRQAVQDKNKELWLIQLPAMVSPSDLKDLEFEVAQEGGPTVKPTAVNDQDNTTHMYQLTDETSQSGVATNNVMLAMYDSTTHPTVPVSKRLVLVRKHAAPAAEQAAGLVSPAKAQPQQEQIQHQHDDDESEDDGQQLATQQAAPATPAPTIPQTPTAGTDAGKSSKKDKSSKKEKKDKKDKSSKKEKKRKRGSDHEGASSSEEE